MPVTPLDDVEFLASSANRVRVLETLAERSATRPELHDVTGISRPTLGRVLTDAEARGWVDRAGREYRLTPLGRLLFDAFGDLLETVETTQRLRAVAPHLPLAALPFDLSHLRDATVTVPHSPDPSAHLRRVGDLVQTAERVRFLGANVYPETVARQRDLVSRGQTYEITLAAAAVDVTRTHPETAATVRELLDSDAVRLYRYEGSVPFSLVTVDDTALVLPYDEEDTPCALLETSDPVVHEWVDRTLDEYREAATRVTAADFDSLD
ncbi:hypothetical protein N0B31_00340 [Salinirubellus salinus]|uniref:Uncharacterized protein n=1 Tax=Salinirubellus salinus TaxID=1364945 RepID=A0A9E7R3U8_9EURY|nr:hypothetical protein [Salinirubellus salinus]UWM54744.1 hypothetical protein N0B31_00340 [Salinirubellus salinus]